MPVLDILPTLGRVALKLKGRCWELLRVSSRMAASLAAFSAFVRPLDLAFMPLVYQALVEIGNFDSTNQVFGFNHFQLVFGLFHSQSTDFSGHNVLK